ncbi:MAG: helix-hairpin-helix domain-containing protein [Phycisphaerales bacterium]|nr:helix-hairpin-helix domain-containing protein [Phycisphaerales bacterium]
MKPATHSPAAKARETHQRVGLCVGISILGCSTLVLSFIAPSVPSTQGTVQVPVHRVDLSTASASELALLPNVGPALAQRIIQYRTEHGAFESLEQFQEVEGIGPKTAEAIAEEIRGFAHADDLDARGAKQTR